MEHIKIKRENGKIYSHIREKWLVETPEELVRQEYIRTLVNEYGYPLSVMSEEYKADYKGRGVRSTRVDILIYKSEKDKANNYNAFIVVECKAETIKIMLPDFYQGTEYAQKTRARFLILHNSKETNYYSVDIEKIPNKEDGFKRITTIPKYSEINNDKRLQEIEVSTISFDRKSFTDMLFSCHNIIRNNDKLSPEAAFDEISKILFIKINYERDEKGKSIFTLKQYQHNKKVTDESNRINRIQNPPVYMQSLFEQTKEQYSNQHLFEDNEKINIRESSFEQILEKLEIYNLSATDDDVKGIAFEQFLGKTFRGELGQFFTPRTIVDFMTDILDPEERETICDPTCGSGGFLIKAFDFIRTKIEKDIDKEKEKFRLLLEGDNFEELSEDEQIKIHAQVDEINSKLNTELDHMHEGSRMYELSHNQIYGTDANPRMARVSKMNMIMHGDGHGGVHHHDGLLNVNGIFEERFDVILTNPPFGSRIDKTQKITEADMFTDNEMIMRYTEKYGDDYVKALGQVNDNIGKKLLSLYDTGSMSVLTEVLFMERCLKLLKKGGRMGMVLPEGVLNTTNLQKVREYFESKAKIILICSIPQDVFVAAGATVKPSLVFFKRFTDEEEQKYAESTEKARAQIRATYNDEIVSLRGEISLLNDRIQDKKENKTEIKREIKVRTVRLSAIEEAIVEEAKPLVKEYFDYEIPIAMIEDAGITSTGANSTGNQLPDLLAEYNTYRKTSNLWEEKINNYSYCLKNGKLYRVANSEEVEIKYE